MGDHPAGLSRGDLYIPPRFARQTEAHRDVADYNPAWQGAEAALITSKDASTSNGFTRAYA